MKTLILATWCVGLLHSHSAVIYVEPPTPLDATGPGWGFTRNAFIDMDNDGKADFHFNTNTELSLVTSLNSGSIIGFQPPLDIGGEVEPLQLGILIGIDTLPDFLNWIPGENFINGCSFDGCSGPFFGPEGYIGVRFYRRDQLHYGWVRFLPSQPVVEDGPVVDSGGFILDWAYESEPGKTIVAGQIPEPGTVILSLSGLVFLRRRREFA